MREENIVGEGKILHRGVSHVNAIAPGRRPEDIVLDLHMLWRRGEDDHLAACMIIEERVMIDLRMVGVVNVQHRLPARRNHIVVKEVIDDDIVCVQPLDVDQDASPGVPKADRVAIDSIPRIE
jgi:hypothetical protein